MRKYACCYAQGRPGAREFRSRVEGSLRVGVSRGRRSLVSSRRVLGAFFELIFGGGGKKVSGAPVFSAAGGPLRFNNKQPIRFRN